MAKKEAAKTVETKTVNTGFIDNVEALEAKMKEMREAQKIFATFTQEQVDKIFYEAAMAANKQRIPLAKMAVEELKDFLENGNIRNSVNFPACDMGVRDKTRITILHRNIPNMIGQFTALLAKDNVNIDDMTNKSRGSYAYTMIDVDNDVAEDVVKGLEMIEGVLKVRVIA